MKPIINLDELDDFEEYDKGPFGERCSGVSGKIGAKSWDTVSQYFNPINESALFIITG